MSTAVLQSEITMTRFGGVGLPWPDPHRQRILLQTPSAFPRMIPQAGARLRRIDSPLWRISQRIGLPQFCRVLQRVDLKRA